MIITYRIFCRHYIIDNGSCKNIDEMHKLIEELDLDSGDYYVEYTYGGSCTFQLEFKVY